MRVVVSVHDQLMGPAYHLKVVLEGELVADILAPTKTSASW